MRLGSQSYNYCEVYISLVRPHLDCACIVWDTHTSKERKYIENFQKFTCKILSKRWDIGYGDLLQLMNLPSLEQRRSHLKLCLII